MQNALHNANGPVLLAKIFLARHKFMQLLLQSLLGLLLQSRHGLVTCIELQAMYVLHHTRPFKSSLIAVQSMLV